MEKNVCITICIALITLSLISGCSIETPEIHGVVLDAETKQPVEGAWVSSNIELTTKTGGGDTHSAISIDEPHTRTDKQGRFVVPLKKIKKPLPPFGFGTDVLAFGVGATTVDDRSGGVKYFGGYYKRDFGKGDGDLEEILRMRKLELIIYVKSIEKTESDYFFYIQSLYNYCISGRFSVDVPIVKEGCDDWELDFTITKHEMYLERTSFDGEHAGGTLKQLGYLYKKKGDYVKATEAFKTTLDYDKKRNIRFRKGEVEAQIRELEQLIREKEK
jgi:hypothetical protein